MNEDETVYIDWQFEWEDIFAISDALRMVIQSYENSMKELTQEEIMNGHIDLRLAKFQKAQKEIERNVEENFERGRSELKRVANKLVESVKEEANDE